ncbi:hypothetical protein SPHINGOT1_660018 [Sphingomonas sp. T1]|nr:hypothetical protein SPHINGOT1_660018 [Sphingomonas sp. T1]
MVRAVKFGAASPMRSERGMFASIFSILLKWHEHPVDAMLLHNYINREVD